MVFIFFFNDTATTEIYTLSLHDALPIFGDRRVRRRYVDDLLVRERVEHARQAVGVEQVGEGAEPRHGVGRDRKSTRLNSSHANISYAVFCLKKKKNNICHTKPLSYLACD